MKTVYMCFSTDILHSGHIEIIQRAAALGELVLGALTDEAIATFKRYPLIPLEERVKLYGSLGYHNGRVAELMKNALAFASVGGTEEMHRKNIFNQMQRLAG